MNRTLIIVAGVIILVLILVTWLYLMLFGTPESREEVFTNLGFSITPQSTTVTPPPPSTPIESLVDTNTGSLRQLTTRPVAGYIGYLEGAVSKVRYAERGTGYVYDINLATGDETIMSRTTIPLVAEATFSSEGNYVVLTSFDGYTRLSRAGSISNGSFEGTELEPGADNFNWRSPGVLRYTAVTNGTSIGYEQNLTTGNRTEVFRFAFTSIHVSWEGEVAYITPRAGQGVVGTTYKIVGTTVTPITQGGLFYTAIPSSNGSLTGSAVNGAYQTTFQLSTSSVTIPLLALPEKCARALREQTLFWCAAPFTTPDASSIDAWYKGAENFSDQIWLINATSQTAQLVASPEKLLERSLDITHLSTHQNNTMILFKHRQDQTLWLYDLLAL